MRRLSLLALAGLTLPATAQPQTLVPETVVTATRVPTLAERLPAATTVIDRATIEERGYTTLTEALAAVPGVTVVPSGGAGQQASVFIRGSNSRHVLVLMDGQPIADASEPNGAFNFGDEVLADIERIEIVRGPASVYYGSGAVGGVINLITRRAPRDRAFQPFGEAAAGSPRTAYAFGGAGGTLRDERLGLFDYTASAQTYSTQGSNATADRIFPALGEKDGARLAGGTARLGWEPEAGTRIEAFGRRRETRIGLDDRPFGGGFDDPNYGALNTRTTLRLSGETKAFQGFWTTGLVAFYGEDERKFTNDPDALNAASTRDNYRGQRSAFEWNNTLRPGFAGAVSETAIIFGVRRTDEDVDSANGSPSFRTVTDARNGSTGFYLGGQARLFALLDVTGGVRNEQDEDFGSNTTWNLGGVLAVPGLPLPLRLRAAAGTSFKAPSLFQRFGTITGFFAGNPDLRPEKGTSWEAGAEADLPLPLGGAGTIGVTYFESRIRDLIDFNAEFDTLENRDRAKISGVEFTTTLRPARWLETVASFTWLDARDRATDKPLPRRPSHSGSLTVRVMPVEGVVVTPEVTYAGTHREGAFATYLDDSSSLDVPANTKGATLVNLSATWAVLPRVTLFATGRNLTDRNYEPANSFQVAGRTVLGGVRARW
jgi:vitamin B12 transporter